MKIIEYWSILYLAKKKYIFWWAVLTNIDKTDKKTSLFKYDQQWKQKHNKSKINYLPKPGLPVT